MVVDSEYAEWDEVRQKIAPSNGTVLLLGGVDTGKTTLLRLLTQDCLAQGQEVAILDADPGQSEIAPPACVGLASPQQGFTTLSEIPPTTLAFVGRTTPQGSLLEYVTAVVRLAQRAQERRIIVDTSGYLHGTGARQLYHTLFDLLKPAHVIALQRKAELTGIIAPLKFREDCTLHTPAIPACIQKKPSTFRAVRRAMRYAGYFQEAALHTLSFDEVALAGIWLARGTPVPPHVLKYLNQAVGGRVYHAEVWGNDLGMMLSHPLREDSPAHSQILQHLKVQSLTQTLAPSLKYLLVGLEDGRGEFLGMGILEALDFRRRTLGIRAPIRRIAAVRTVRFGMNRVQADGVERGALPPSAF
jgi:polynucleotide 5'-hydroxyl-kinase GRC3/NOL9